MLRKLTAPLIAAGAAALVLVTTTALAGSGVGGVFNLGQTNTVNAQSILTGNPGGNPLLRVTGSGTAATLRADATSGTAVNGISVSGTGQAGQSTNGTGLDGRHSAATGSASGVFGQTASSDPSSAGVTGRNTGGGPGLQAIVNSNSIPPIKVNSTAKVTNLNADRLDGLDSTGFWTTIGNGGTSPGTNFIGTTDNQELWFEVNDTLAFRLEPNATSPSVYGGAGSNLNPTGNGAYGITVSGGGGNQAGSNLATIGGGTSNVAGDLGVDPTVAQFATVGGGSANHATAAESTIGGGANNIASALGALIGGGDANTASGQDASVAGGSNNQASNSFATVAGGSSNIASGLNSTVPGGYHAIASGNYSFAAGREANASQAGSFVWADGTGDGATSPAANSFTVKAAGGTQVVGAGGLTVQLGRFATAIGNYTAGDTTPSVTGGNLFSLANSSSTTITRFFGVTGQTITLIFNDGNTTIQATTGPSNSIHLAGGVNYNPGVGDTLTLVTPDGANWFEVSRSDN